MKAKPQMDENWKAMFLSLREKGAEIVSLNVQCENKTDADIPRLAIYPPHSGSPRGSVIVCAGGAFIFKSRGEAEPVADFFYKNGYHAAILDYRVMPHTREESVADGHRAIQYLRCHAEKYNINPKEIVICGFSAGGILSNLAATTYALGNPDAIDPIERFSSRPDGVILGYGAFSDVTNIGAGLGFDFKEQNKKARLSPDLLLHPDVPPYFMFQTINDDPRIIANMQIRLTEMGIPFEAHTFMGGYHGSGLYDGNNGTENTPHTAHWAELAVVWLEKLEINNKR